MMLTNATVGVRARVVTDVRKHRPNSPDTTGSSPILPIHPEPDSTNANLSELVEQRQLHRRIQPATAGMWRNHREAHRGLLGGLIHIIDAGHGHWELICGRVVEEAVGEAGGVLNEGGKRERRAGHEVAKLGGRRTVGGHALSQRRIDARGRVRVEETQHPGIAGRQRDGQLHRKRRPRGGGLVLTGIPGARHVLARVHASPRERR